MRSPFLAILLGLLGLLDVAVAQTTHLVGPGGHPQITAAIAAASPGDVVLVQPGTYQPFTLTIGLTIRAVVPGTVHVQGGWGPLSNVVAGQAAHFVGLDFDWLFVGGRLTLDSCTLISPAALSSQPLSGYLAEVHLVRGLPGNAPSAAVHLNNSEMTATGCTFVGPDANWLGPAGAAVELFASTLRASDSTFTGGTGSPNYTRAVWGDAASTIWLADSTLVSNSTACPISASNGRHARCTLTPNCASIPAGPVLGIRAPQPLQNGMPFVLELRTTPGALVGVWVAFDLANMPVPLLEQTLLLPIAGAWSAGFFVADPSWPIPAGPAVVNRSLWFQAFDASSAPLQASGIAGGIVR